MSKPTAELVDRYTSALKDYLSGGGEGALQQAYALGRGALADGLLARIVTPEYLPLARRMLARKLAGEVERTRYEVEIVARDGRRIPVEVSTGLIYQDGRPVGVHGIARDMTERKRAEQALWRLNERLEEAEAFRYVRQQSTSAGLRLREIASRIVVADELLLRKLNIAGCLRLILQAVREAEGVRPIRAA